MRTGEEKNDDLTQRLQTGELLPLTLSSCFPPPPLILVLNAFGWWFVYHAFYHQQWRPLNPFTYLYYLPCISVCDPVFTVKTWEKCGGEWFVQGNWWAMCFICGWPHLHPDCPSRVLCVHPWLHLSEILKSEPNTNLWMKSQKYFRRSSMKRKLSSGGWVTKLKEKPGYCFFCSTLSCTHRYTHTCTYTQSLLLIFQNEGNNL